MIPTFYEETVSKNSLRAVLCSVAMATVFTSLALRAEPSEKRVLDLRPQMTLEPVSQEASLQQSLFATKPVDTITGTSGGLRVQVNSGFSMDVQTKETGLLLPETVPLKPFDFVGARLNVRF